MSRRTKEVHSLGERYVGFLGKVEKLCNKMPDAFFLFIYIFIIVVCISAVTGGATESLSTVTESGKTIETEATIVNLLTVDYLRGLLVNMVSNYIGFAAIGMVMVLMMGIGVAQHSGLFETLMRSTLSKASPVMLTAVLAFVGANSSLASSAGIVLSTSLGATMFSALGKNPVKGALIGYVSSHGGWSACVLPFGTDVLISGITQTAAESLGLDVPIHPLMNYYFMFVFTFVVTGTVTLVAERLMPEIKYGEIRPVDPSAGITPEEKRGLKYAGIASLILLALLLLATVPPNAVLRNEDGQLLPSSPLIDGIVGILFLFFVIAGAAYGYGAGTIKHKKEIPQLMAQGLMDMRSFLVFSFTAAICINAFNDSQLGAYLAIKASKVFIEMGLGPVALALGLMLVTCVVNLFITAVNTKWMILAPIFVPMFATLGLSPALTAMIYRVGDSIVDPISPINMFLPITVGIMNQYRKKDDPEIGIGTLISMTLPFVIALAIVGTLMVILWIVFDLPLGPGVSQMI